MALKNLILFFYRFFLHFLSWTIIPPLKRSFDNSCNLTSCLCHKFWQESFNEILTFRVNLENNEPLVSLVKTFLYALQLVLGKVQEENEERQE